ncbi:MAG: hypothetical protein IJY18_05525, partial [Clostridia bacterium]|nr:hypothetical protein [Clostridia bacterium]
REASLSTVTCGDVIYKPSPAGEGGTRSVTDEVSLQSRPDPSLRTRMTPKGVGRGLPSTNERPTQSPSVT